MLTDIQYGEWEPGTNQYNGHRVRKLDYKVKTDNMFISRGYVSTESQQVDTVCYNFKIYF